jgi:hypothetical protein
MGKISVLDFEAKVLEREEVVIRIRAPSSEMVEDYDYSRKATGSTSITDFLDTRIRPLLDGKEVSIIDGSFASPHGRTKLDRVRSSYE